MEGGTAHACAMHTSQCCAPPHVPDTSSPQRADGGVDDDRYENYWADQMFECNNWGGYCSKVSPNINVLGLLKASA